MPQRNIYTVKMVEGGRSTTILPDHSLTSMHYNYLAMVKVNIYIKYFTMRYCIIYSSQSFLTKKSQSSLMGGFCYIPDWILSMDLIPVLFKIWYFANLRLGYCNIEALQNKTM
jgi:hypothetical protein